MNMIDVTVRDGQARTKTGFAMPLAGPLTQLAPGRYRLGIRANHLYLERRSEADVEIEGEVDLAEISGSETFVHLRHNNLDWVVQEEGVHPMERGAEVTFYLDPPKALRLRRHRCPRARTADQAAQSTRPEGTPAWPGSTSKSSRTAMRQHRWGRPTTP
jgi:ABC-type sugar transport system ATPase subunit